MAWNLLYLTQPYVAAQMLDNVYGDLTYRVNGGIPGDFGDILTTCVNAGYSYGANYIEIYETDVRHLTTVITYARHLLAPDTPAILRQPVSRQVVLGQSAKFIVDASGDYLTYQWEKG